MSQYGTFLIRGGLGPVNTLTGNTGGPVPPDGSGNINVIGSGVISVAGNPGTSTLTITGTGSIPSSFATDSGTAVPSGGVLTVHGVSPLTTSGSGSTVSISIGSVIPIADGGTNATSMANTDGVVYFDGTRLVTTAVGTATYVLTSNGAGLAPTFQAAASGGIVTLDGDSGSATGSTVTISGGTTGLTTTASSATMDLTGTLIVGNGGTGATTFTSHGVLLGNATGAITATANGTTGQLFTATTGSAPGWANAPASSISITGNTGGALTGASFTFTGGTTGLTFAGAGTTETLGGTLVVANGGTGAATLTGVLIGNGTSAVSGNAITQHDVLVGGASNAITSVAPGATSGVALVSQGSSSDPHFGTVVVAGGGSGVTSHTAYMPICGGTTTTGGVQSVNPVGALAGYVLTFVSSSALPTWQAGGGGGGITTIDGDTGSVTGSTVTIYADQAANGCGSSVGFSGSSATLTLNVTDGSGNTVIGSSAGNGSIGIRNTVIGSNGAGAVNSPGGVLTGNYNTIVTGAGGGSKLTSGSFNSIYGYQAQISNAGEFNVCIGNSSGDNNATGITNNVLIGQNAGNNYTGTEAYNILIGDNQVGVNGETGATHIGTNGNTTKCYVEGIRGVTVTTTAAVLVGSNNQLGTVISSRKVKDDIVDMGDKSSSLLNLRPVNFVFKEDKTRYMQWGLIAEEVAEVFPDIVNFDASGSPESVRYHDMPAILLNELQKLRREFEEFKASCGCRRY